MKFFFSLLAFGNFSLGLFVQPGVLNGNCRLGRKHLSLLNILRAKFTPRGICNQG